MRKFIWAVILMLGVVFIIGQFAEMQAIAETLKRGDWRFMFLGLGIEVVWLVNTAACYRMIYQAMGIDEQVKNLLPVAAASIFANVVAPIGGVSGAAVFAAEAWRRGYSPGRAIVAGALFILFDYAAFECPGFGPPGVFPARQPEYHGGNRGGDTAGYGPGAGDPADPGNAFCGYSGRAYWHGWLISSTGSYAHSSTGNTFKKCAPILLRMILRMDYAAYGAAPRMCCGLMRWR